MLKNVKNVLVVAALAVSGLVSAQDYVSRKQHINTVNGKYLLQQINTYFTIENGVAINTDKKKKKTFSEWKLNEVWVENDKKIKVYIEEIPDSNQTRLVYKFIDTFTNKSGVIYYDLVAKSN